MYERYLDVSWAVNYLDEVMGTDWLKESLKLLKGYASGGGSFGRGIDLSACEVSETAYYWYRAREELALDIIGGQGPGLYALQAAVIGDDLWVLRDSQGLSERVEGLKQPADAGQVITELVIAAGYARSGRRVVFTNQVGIFNVLGPKINVYLEHCNRCPGPGNGNTRVDKMVSSEGCTQNQPDTAFSVFYRYQNKPGLNSYCDFYDAEPGGMDCAGSGDLVVNCSFIARQGPRGPEIVRSYALAEGHQPAPDRHIPNEIIMPVRE